MTDEKTLPVFERGDVVYGDDPFKGGEEARPWLVLSNLEGRPFHGEQYIRGDPNDEVLDGRPHRDPRDQLASWWNAG